MDQQRFNELGKTFDWCRMCIAPNIAIECDAISEVLQMMVDKYKVDPQECLDFLRYDIEEMDNSTFCWTDDRLRYIRRLIKINKNEI